MAGTSPTRRSSRARLSQPQSQAPSATSSSSGRTERSTRAFTKTGSPQKSTGTGSLSSEPPEDSNAVSTTDDSILRRRSTRGKDEERDKKLKADTTDMPSVNDDIQEDDESVRCICGHDEYPGPPPFDEDSKHGVKDAIDHDRIFAIEITDDMAGFFVQCEICNTWQHGACVGFTTEESNPDDLEYFCEQCRKDLHKIYTASNGQKYSIFLPIHRPSQAPSRAASATKEGAKSPKPTGSKSARAAAAAAAAAQTSKRRSTMNSRDAAYDEEEQLRQAIEASKEETIPEDSEIMTKRPKRGRDDSEENTESSKRQRTHSKSPSPAVEQPDATAQDESDEETALHNDAGRRSRNAVRNQRERAEREERREEQERKRAEAASKRKGRAERRRADDSDPSEELPLAARAIPASRATDSAQPPEPSAPSSQPTPDSPPSAQAPATTQKKKASHSKKKGRNQYTKDRDNDHEGSPARSVPRDTPKHTDDNGSTNTKSTNHDSGGKHSKGKGGMNSRVTMSDMKRRVNGILEYITRKQVDLANDPISETTFGPGNIAAEHQPAVNPKPRSSAADKSLASDTPTTNGVVKLAQDMVIMSKDFKDMTCVEMMDDLTRDLVKWQQEYAP